MPAFQIGRRRVGDSEPVYFIADISANHDGELERARALIHLAAESGADAAKFQNFRAEQIVSGPGFAALGGQLAHQAAWKKPVTEVYRGASLPWEWTECLKRECDRAGIEYFSTPYDLEAVDMLEPWVSVYKIGSGDITWLELLRAIASKHKPVLLATGASDLADVQRAMAAIGEQEQRICLMQCNTNYSGGRNFPHIHLNVLRSYALMYPEAVLGLSDHTRGHVAVLGAVALGAKVIEKHFTDDPSREGPDHPFSMSPSAWREMVDRTREMESALGGAVKEVAGNEQETYVVQRRCVRAAQDLAAGTVLTRDLLAVLRPAPAGCIPPYEIERLAGRSTRVAISGGVALRWEMLECPPNDGRLAAG
ncbi:MAG TPA: N-acetylneuraminate synthase family protein [Bryobacteraceae bacterium]